jgi:hypothetical protein
MENNNLIDKWNIISTDLLYSISFIILDFNTIIKLFRINQHWYQYFQQPLFWQQYKGIISWNCALENKVIPKYLTFCKRWRLICIENRKLHVYCNWCAQNSQRIVANLKTLEISSGFLNQTCLKQFLYPQFATLTELSLNFADIGSNDSLPYQDGFSPLSLPNLIKFSVLHSSPDMYQEDWVNAFLLAIPNVTTIYIRIPGSLYGEHIIISSLSKLSHLTNLSIRMELLNIDTESLNLLALLPIQILNVELSDVEFTSGHVLPALWHETLIECTFFIAFEDGEAHSYFQDFCQEFIRFVPLDLQFKQVQKLHCALDVDDLTDRAWSQMSDLFARFPNVYHLEIHYRSTNTMEQFKFLQFLSTEWNTLLHTLHLYFEEFIVDGNWMYLVAAAFPTMLHLIYLQHCEIHFVGTVAMDFKAELKRTIFYACDVFKQQHPVLLSFECFLSNESIFQYKNKSSSLVHSITSKRIRIE